MSPPLGLCVLASTLLQAAHSVRVLDLDLELKTQSYRSYTELLESEMADYQPQVIGFTSMYNNSLHAEVLIRAARRSNQMRSL